MNVTGLTTVSSAHSAKETIDRLEAEVKARGMAVFARIDHAAGAKEAGMTLRPTELLIFGNAKAGTPLMQADQTMGIELPLKVLAWEDQERKVWLCYNDPSWLADRHGLSGSAAETARRMQMALAAVSTAAAGD